MSLIKTIYKSLFFIIIMAAFIMLPPQHIIKANAQISQYKTDISMLTLANYSDSYDIAPHAFLTAKTNDDIKYSDVYSAHIKGNKGKQGSGNYINLIKEGTPHWILFSLKNDSDTEDWVLDFGDRTDGRFGYIDSMYIYDSVSKKLLVDAMNKKKIENFKKNKLIGNAIPLTFKKGSNALIVLYYNPAKGLPTTLPLKLTAEKTYIKSIGNQFNKATIYFTIFSAIIIFFLAISYLAKQPYYLLFALYFILHASIFYLWESSLITPSTGINYIFIAIITAISILSSIITYKFLNLDASRIFERTLTIGLIVLPIIMPLFVGAITSFNDISVILTSVICLNIVFIGIILISLIQTQCGSFIAHYYMAAWILPIFGISFTTMSASGTLSPSFISLSMYEFSIFIQAAFLITSTCIKFDKTFQQYDGEEAYEDDEDVNKNIAKYSKEKLENQRLIKLIEQERKVLTELKEKEERRSEEMLKAKEEADAANKAKSAFLAMISHEIRTPMTGIMGMVKLLTETKLTKEQHDYAMTIQESSDSMLALLNDILDFEKIESGKLSLELIDFDLHRLINGIATLMNGHATDKNIELRAELGADVPQYVVGDPTRLRQVLLNLTNNAIKFTSKGYVSLKLKLISSTKDPYTGETEHKIYFAVEDTGIGISEEGQKNLFTPFSQADQSITRKFGGTGLGLAICKGLVMTMGSEIEIKSMPRRGSTFYFTLNMQEGNKALAEQNAKAGYSSATTVKSNINPMHILVIEDNEINHKVLAGILEKNGHEVTAAFNSDTAFESLKRESYDFILMDMQLPGKSGIEITREIRKSTNPTIANTIIIAMTGNTDDESKFMCYQAGMNDFLPKPITPEAVLTMIKKVASGDLENPIEQKKTDEEGEIFEEIKSNPPNETEISEEVSERPKEKTTTPYPDYIGKISDDQYDPFANIPKEEFTKEKPPEKIDKQISENNQIDNDDLDDVLDEDSFEIAIKKLDEENNIKNLIKTNNKTDTENIKSQDDNKIFDESMLAGLRDSLGKDQVKELADGLFEKAEEIIENLKTASNENNIQIICERSHELKGMAGNFGLIQIEKIAKNIEKIAKNEENPDMNTLSGIIHLELPATFTKSKTILYNWLG